MYSKDLDYKELAELIETYEKRPLKDIQNDLKSVIKTYKVSEISEKTGISRDGIYRYTKKIFLKIGQRPTFSNYVKIMAMKKEV